jgi:uncharacterized membrane protein
MACRSFCFRREVVCLNRWENLKNRLKSPVIWTSLIAQIVAILLLVGVINVTESQVVEQVVALLMQILVAVGVFNNPTDRVNW